MAVVQTGSITQLNEAFVTANTGTVSTTITVPSDAELVVVGVSAFTTTASYYSGGSLTFTKGGVDTAMTVAVTGANGGDNNAARWMCAMFYMALPDTGSNKTLKWDWAGAGAQTDDFQIFSLTFWKGCDTSSPVRSALGAQSGGVPYTTGTLTAVSGDLIIAVVGTNPTGEGTANTWSNLALLGQLTANGDADGAWATGSPSGNTTVALSTATNYNDGGIVAIVVKAAAATGIPNQIYQTNFAVKRAAYY